MNRTLHITNGDCAVQSLQGAGIQGAFLPWRDILHEGPVNVADDLHRLSTIRADFLAGEIVDGCQRESVLQSFIDRDALLLKAAEFDEVVLWFEQDLYDQLQLLQILTFLPEGLSRVFLINTDTYLTDHANEQLQQLFDKRNLLRAEQVALAKQAWSAFCDSSPVRWQQLLQQDTNCLPHLQKAVLRMLQQYPHYPHGLCRVGLSAVALLNEGPLDGTTLFARYQQTESDRFLGDSVFFALLKPLVAAGIIKKGANHYVITEIGRGLLAGKNNILRTLKIDRWIGGVHLSHNNPWFWDDKVEKVIRTTPITE